METGGLHGCRMSGSSGGAGLYRERRRGMVSVLWLIFAAVRGHMRWSMIESKIEAVSDMSMLSTSYVYVQHTTL